MIEMVNTLYIPAAIEYQNQLIATVTGLTQALGKDPSIKSQVELLRQVSIQVDSARRGADALAKALANAEKVDEVAEKAVVYCHKVKPLFDPLRASVDTLETLVPAKVWPVPKYREMLFLI